MQLLPFMAVVAVLGAEPIEPPRLCTPAAQVATVGSFTTPEAYTPSAEVVDDTIWWRYLRSNKTDWVGDRVKTKVGKKTRWRVVYREAPYGGKDPTAAERLGMGLMEYVVGGATADFKLRLYCLAAAAVAEGHDLVITSLFRDDYRQSIAEGKKAASNNSFHGGSKHGGYGHGIAADVTTLGSMEKRLALWSWIDKNAQRFKIGRPYGTYDQPHVGPIDGPEYLAKHGSPTKVATAAKHKGKHRKGKKKKRTRLASR